MTQTDIAKLLVANLYDHSAPAPEEQIVFRIQFKRIGSLGDFILFSGRPKSGKTKYLSGSIAAAVSSERVFDMQIKLPANKKGIVHFDTEQSRYSHWKMMQLILQLCNTQTFPDHFKSYRCRSVAPAQILSMVEYYIKANPQTGIVYLDGLLDTIESMNDEKHSSYIKRWLKRITEDYNVLLAGVIHRGFSNDKSIGQIGSEGERAAQTVLLVEKDKETKQYILKAEYMRDDDEFDPVAIYYNKQLSIWEQTEYINKNDQPVTRTAPVNLRKRRPAEYDISEHRAACSQIFNATAEFLYDQLIKEIIITYGVGSQWAKDCIIHLRNEGLIFKTDTGFTNKAQAKIFKTDIA